MENLVRRNGVWYVRRMVHGRVRRISTRQTDRELAKKAARKILGAIDTDTVDELIGKVKRGPIPTYAAFVEEYLASVSVHKARPINDKMSLRRSVEAWGARPINTISLHDCIELLASLRAGHRSENIVALEWTLCKAMFNHAKRLGLLQANPWAELPKVLRPHRRPRTRVLERDEQGPFLGQLTGVYYDLAVVAMGAGLRGKELRGLVPKRHCDFANHRLMLTPDIVKGGKRGRSLPMLPEVKDVLLRRLAMNGGDQTKPLFQYHVAEQSRVFRAAATAVRIPIVTMHDLRRTFGTRCAEAGVPMHKLKDWMGHSSITITEAFYTHSSGAFETQLAQRIDGQMGLPATRDIVVPFAGSKA